MPISFKSLLSSSVANDTFVDATVDDSKKGKLGLFKSTTGESGAISDMQNYANELANTIGQNNEGDPNRKNYSSNNVISDGDSHKVALGKFDAQVQTNIDNISSNATNITNNTRTVFINEAIAAGGAVTKSDDLLNQIRRVSGDGAAITLAAKPFGDSASTAEGVLIVLRGTSAANTVTLQNNDAQYGAIVNGDMTLRVHEQIALMYDKVAERWIEQWRKDFVQ